jgi:AMIN domain
LETMKATRIQLGILLLWVSSMTAQTPAPATVQQLQVVNAGSDVRIELRLSATVKPSLTVATKPDRLVLELPNTRSEGKQRRVAVHVPGIRGIRIGLHQGEPPVTRLVVDLDESVPYQLLTEGNRLTLVLSTPSVARSKHTPPARAVSGGLGGMLRSGSKPVAPSSPFPESADASAPAVSSPSNSDATGPAAQANAAGQSPNSSVTAVAPPATQPHATEAGSTFPVATIATSSGTSASSSSQQANASLPTSAGTGSEAKLPDASANSASATPTADAVAAEPVAKAPPTSPPTDQTLLTLQAADPNLRTVFRVKYVADGAVYLDGGSSSGLGESMKLEIRDTNLPLQQGTIVDPGDPQVVAELEVTAAAETSSVADIHSPKRPVKVGDLAYLSTGDAQALIQQRTLSATRKYPAVVTFTDNDAMDEEAHDEVPRPPMPSVNRARGMFGIDYMGTVSQGSTAITSNNIGGVMRLDMTRIGGTYWNARGYWRGNFTTESASSQPTLQNLINRTYHLNMTYENPNSRLVAGFGRLYLPWAPSLDTIDGGYFGARLSKESTIGMFAGSTPDPTSYSYNPDGKIAGVFINFEGGSYDATHYTSTSGAGMNAVKWQINRPFVFFENAVSYKRYLSIYDSMQLDSPRGTPAAAAPGPGLGRNFLTIRIQPHPRFEFDVNHTYFRDIPTYDPTLLSLGLLDKFLFQGFSVGGRVEVVKQIWVYTDIGQSNRTGDAQNSLNQAFGITFNRIPKLDLHVDAHYSKFSSSYGSGSYRAFSVSRSVTDRLHLDILFGDQSFSSSLTSNNRSKFVNANVETSFGSHYFLQGGFTVNRGSMSYNQWMYTLGYRFDSRMKKQ